MSKLINEIDDLWDITLDLVQFFHECCIYCMPRDSGEYVWLSSDYLLGDVIEEYVHDVCDANSHQLKVTLNRDIIENALKQKSFTCQNCGAEHESYSSQIGGEWLVARGEQTKKATYLLTKSYWPFLTHYTKPTDSMSSLEVLMKMASEEKIEGTKKYIRGNDPVVCFTECSPLEILELTKATKKSIKDLPHKEHKVSWKKSEHGICIKRNSLIKSGAKPVIHGDSEFFDRLNSADHWRFVHFDINQKYIDWTFEREFRYKGNLNLDEFYPFEVGIIVANRSEQFYLLAQREVIPYPIIPFNYVYSTDAPFLRLTERQAKASAA